MGHRANFVVIEEGAAKVFYDQWGAMGCLYAFAGGPDSAVEAVAEMEEAAELMEWAFAEGGYLIDRDRKAAIVFGTTFDEIEAFDDLDDDVATPMREVNAAMDAGPRGFLEHVASAWPGWKLTWDDRGTDAFSAHLRSRGIATIATQPDSHPSTTEPPETLQA